MKHASPCTVLRDKTEYKRKENFLQKKKKDFTYSVSMIHAKTISVNVNM